MSRVAYTQITNTRNDAAKQANHSRVLMSKDQNNKPAFSGIYDNKIGVTEGLKLIGGGFVNKIGDTIKSLVQNPLQSIAMLGVTTLGIAALPLIGIPAATGASLLAVCFAGFAAFNIVKDTYKAVINSKNGDDSSLRTNLRNIGGDAFDLALSLPFMPKGLNQIKRHIKFAPKPELNKNVIRTMKKGNFNDISLGLKQEDLRLHYKTQAKEIGLKVVPDLEFAPASPVLGSYDNITGTVRIPVSTLTSNVTVRSIPGGKLSSREAVVRHELEHVRQASDIAKKAGIEHFSDMLARGKSKICVQKEIFKQLLEIRKFAESNKVNADNFIEINPLLKEAVRQRPQLKKLTTEELKQNIGYMDKMLKMDVNRNYYNQAIAKNPQFADSERIKQYIHASKNYNARNPIEYRNNLLEVDASRAEQLYAVNNNFLRPGIPCVLAQEALALKGKKKQPLAHQGDV